MGEARRLQNTTVPLGSIYSARGWSSEKEPVLGAIACAAIGNVSGDFQGRDKVQDALTVRSHQDQGLSVGADTKIGVQESVVIHLVLARGPDQEMFTGFYAATRELPLLGILKVVGEVVSGQIDGAATGVVEFDPVFIIAIAIGIGDCLAIGRHEFIDNLSLR